MEENNKNVQAENGSSDNAFNTEKTENLSKAELKEIQREKTRAEKREWNERRRIKRGKKALRGRKIKNLLFFITGFISSIVILFGGIAVATKFVPLKTFFGENSEIVKSDTAGEKSAVDFILNLKDYQISDIPVVANLLEGVVTGSGMDDILTIDTEKLKGTHFDSIGQGILNSARISKTLFGDLKDLEMFDTVKVPAGREPHDEDIASSDSNLYKLYYYSTGDENGPFVRAYNDNKLRVEDSVGKQLYYLSLSEMSVNDMKDLFSERFRLLGVKSIFKTLAGVEDDNFINDVFGDKIVKELSDFDKSDITIESVLGEYEKDKNDKLYKLIWDASRYTEDELTHEITYDVVPNKTDPDTGDPVIDPDTGNPVPDYSSLTLNDLSGDKFNVDMVRLNTVLGKPETPEKDKLYKLIWDASRYTEDELTHEITYKPVPEDGDHNPDYSSLNLNDLSGDKFNVDMVRLKTVISSDTGNKVIDKLRKDETVTLDNIGEKANALTLKEILDVEIMVEVEGITSATYNSFNALYIKTAGGYELVEGAFNSSTKEYEYTTLDIDATYYKINPEARVWFLVLTTLHSGEANVDYFNTDSEWGAYSLIEEVDGGTLGDLSELTVDISAIKIKVLMDLGLLSADPSAAAFDYTIVGLLALV